VSKFGVQLDALDTLAAGLAPSFNSADILHAECFASAPPPKRGLHCPGLKEYGARVMLLSAFVGGGDAEKIHGGVR
jgi:hypothetical protein